MDTPTQTDITVRNQNGKKNTASTGVTIAVQTTYALSQSESTDSSIRAQLEVATSHDNEILNPPQNDIPISTPPATDEPCIEPTELKSTMQAKKSVSVLDGNVVTRRCDNQQWKVADADGKQVEGTKAGDIARAPTKILLNLKLDVGQDLIPEDLEIAIVPSTTNSIKVDSTIDDSEVNRNSQIPKDEQTVEKIPIQKPILILMNETNMTVTPIQVQQQYVHTLMPLSDENTYSVLDLASQQMKDVNILDFIESNVSMNMPKDHLSGNLMKVTSLENILLWGIPAVRADSDASVYTNPVKKDQAHSHLDEMEDAEVSATSISTEVESMISLLNPVDTRMILEIQHHSNRSMLMSGRPSTFNNELALRLKLSSDQTLMDTANEIKLVLYDVTNEEYDSAPVSTTAVNDDPRTDVKLSVVTVELHENGLDMGTTVHYTDGAKQISQRLVEGGSPLSIRLSAEQGLKSVQLVDSRSGSSPSTGKMKLSVTRDGCAIGPGSVVFEPGGEPVVMSMPMGDDNVLLTMTTKIVKKGGDKPTTERPVTANGKPTQKAVRAAAEDVVDTVIAQLYSTYTADSRCLTVAQDSEPPAKSQGTASPVRPDESNNKDNNVRMTRSSVMQAIAEGTAPLNAAFDDIRATLADIPGLGGCGHVTSPHTPNLEQTSLNYPPYNYVPHYVYDSGCTNYVTRPPRFLPECHHYDPRHYDYPAPYHELSPRCPPAAMNVTLSQHRNVVPECRDGETAKVATGGKPGTPGNTEAKDRGVFDNIAARCNKCGSEAVELRSKTQGSVNQQCPLNTDK